MRKLPSLQRMLLYIVLIFAISSLIYLLLSKNIYQMDAKRELSKQEGDALSSNSILGAIKNVANKMVNLNKAAVPDQPPTHDPYTGPQNEMQEKVVEAFMHAWNGYKKYAWGHDELKPISRGWIDWFGVGLTIVDSLDTMWMMGLKEEFKVGRDWVATDLNFDHDGEVLLFEIVIRELGGLMSAYHLSKDDIFLQKAKLLGDKLMVCLKGPHKIPCRQVNMHRQSPSFEEISIAEIGTLQLEFKELARQSNNASYKTAVEAVSMHIHGLKKMDGLAPSFISGGTGNFRMTSTISMGASADSYYEYLLKQWIQTGKTQDWLKEDYIEAMEGMKKHLYRTTFPSKLAFVGSLFSMASKGFKSDMEHLACFLPGTLALGHIHGLGDGDHLVMAKELMHTCYEMYRRMPTGLSPEIASMNTGDTGDEDMYINWGQNFNLQRPETVESLFYLYRATGDKMYREWGEKIFQAFEKHTRLAVGYASIQDVKNVDHVGHKDKMETFYLAETLKYLYLLFSDDEQLFPVDKFVFNTEAHPLPVYSA